MRNQRRSVIWRAVHSERQALIDDLKLIQPTQWSTPSLCSGWDIHDVVAHLVDSAKTTRIGFIRRMVAAGFDFDKDNAIGVEREKASNHQAILAKFQAVRTSTDTPPADLATRLVEIIVHGEDIRRPLSICHDYPLEQILAALEYQIKTSVKMGGGKELAQGYRLVAADASFEHGHGAEINGNAIALLLAVSGRPVEADELTGPGVHAFYIATNGDG